MPKKLLRAFEILPNNRLENEILRIVNPFNVILTAVCSSKFKIRNGYITPTTKKFHVLFFFGVMTFNIWSGYKIMQGHNEFTKSAVITYFFWLTTFFYLVDYILLLSCNILHSHRQVSLILKIQEIYKSIDISTSFESYVFWNWMWFLITFCLFGVNLSSFYMSQDRVYFIHLSTYFTNLQFDLNFVYGIRIMTLLVIYLKKWTKSVLVANEEQHNNEYFLNKFKTYLNILEAFKLFTLCFKDIILCRTSVSLLRGLGILEMRLQQNKIAPATFLSFLVFLWTLKNLSLIFMTSIQCDKFYMSMEEAESACIQCVMKPDCPRNVKHLCKRVLQLNRTFSKMSVYGLFTVDATLPIPLASLVSNYIIVLLQLDMM